MPKLGKQGKARVQELKKQGVEKPRKYLIAARQEGFTGKQAVKAAEGGGKRNTRIESALGGSRFSGGGTKADEPPAVSRPPTNVDRSSRVGGGQSTPGGAPAFFDSGGGAGGGAGGGNPLTSGSASSALKDSGDLDRVLHGGKKKGRVRKTRGTE